MLYKIKRRIFGTDNKPRLFYWTRPDGQVNFGDLLSRDIVEGMLIRNDMSLASRGSGRLLALGSILHYAKDYDTIWGSGINFKIEKSLPKFKHLDVRSVRGLLTKKVLEDKGIGVPPVFGDPAILFGDIFDVSIPAIKEYEYLILPNLNDIGKTETFDQRLVINPNQHWVNVVNKICSCNILLTSSLHGIVLSEVLGIDYRFIKLGEAEDLRKYEDYFSGTGRTDFFHYSTIKDALAGKTNSTAIFKKKELVAAFPYDLWIKHKL